MRRERIGMKRGIGLVLAAMLCLSGACALAQEYDAQVMTAWLSRFCEALVQLPLQGDPQRTADPARPGEYLLEYGFGTVTARTAALVQPEDVLEIDVRTPQVTDCRGMRVGMTLGEVTGGQRIGRSSTQLYVLGTQEAGIGFSWAYLGESGVYGVEYITYGGSGAEMTEYTLTYVLDAAQTVSAIRVRCAETTQAQAEQAMRTAEEIASLDFDGVGIGGAIEKRIIGDTCAWICDAMPENRPRHVLGIAAVDDIFACVENGGDTFDCVAPARCGRNGAIFTRDGRYNIKRAANKFDFSPLEEGGDCYTCTHYSRAYVDHLLRAREFNGFTLATIHNEHFFVKLLDDIRASIDGGYFDEFRDETLARFYANGSRG